MTKINKLLLRGFKSFGKRTELVFGNDFNVVLGPNGSGKSNILDALTFVLGRASSKAMRAEKSANLIYNGGKSKKPAKEAEVSIFFDNSKSTFPTPEAEVKISRIVRHNGQSIYKINDKTRTRQQILDLMALSKIDPEGYNIILQGDIVRFCEMSTNDRRLVIEEIAGIGVYEEKKQKAIRELEKVEEKLKEAEIILTERNTYLKELKKERDQALEYKNLNDRIDQSKAAYLSIQIKKREEKEQELQVKVDDYQKQIDELQDKINGLKEVIQEKETGIKEINEEIEQKGEVEQVKLNKEIEALRISIATAQTKIESNKVEIEKIKERKKQLQLSLGEVDEKIKDLEEEKQRFLKEKQNVENDLKKIDASVDAFKKKNKLGEDLAAIEKRVDEIDKLSEEKQKEIHELRENQQELLREKDKLMFQIQACEEAIDKVSNLEKENKDQIKLLKQKREEFKKATDNLNKFLDEDSSLSVQLANSRSKLFKNNEELARLRARNISIKEKVSGGKAIQTVLNSNTKGVYGTVSDLGQVNKKYALALEVAAGARIKSIVVDDDKIAQKCINLLKDKKAGIATFTPLNKIKGRLIKSEVYDLCKKEGVHGLAIDLVKFDEKFRQVFSHVFSDTVVVDDIDTARKIGIGRTRMVTLDGDLIEISGAMIGGYRTKHEILGFKEEDVLKDMSEYEDVIKNLENVLRTLEKRKIENEQRIVDLRTQKHDLEGEILTLENKLNIEANGDLGDVKTQRNEMLNKSKDVENSIKDVEKSIGVLNKELMDIKIEKQQLRDKINELRNPAVIAELNAFEDKRRELRESIIHLESDIKNVDSQTSNILTSEKENTLKIIKQHEKEIEDFENEIKSLNEKVDSENKDLKIKEDNAKEFYAKFKQLFGRRDSLDTDIKKLDRQSDEHDIRIKGLEQKISQLNMEKAKYTAELSGLRKEFEPYKDVKIDHIKKSEEELRKEINKFEVMLENVGAVNMKALEIYDNVEKEYQELLKKKDKLGQEKEDVLVLMDEIETKKKDIFMKSYNVINENFGKIFSTLSNKGEAYLELEDPETVFEGGVYFKVKITGNKFLDIKSLSGGEKTMTALAFIFSIQEYEPASFYILDEVDAALDKANSEKLAQLVRKYSEKAQYVVISHNDAVISEASKLYGISMDEHGLSAVVSLRV